MFTVIVTKPPYADDDARLALDMVMIAVSLDLDVQVLFQGDGVLQLLPLNANALQMKNPLAKYPVLTDIFEVSSLYTCAQSLAERQLDTASLTLPVTALSAHEFQDRLNLATKVVRF